MNGRFPYLTWLLAAVGVLWLGMLAVGKSGPAATTPASTDANRPANQSPISGDQLLETAQKVMLKRRSVQARVRLQVRMLDVELVGSGTYLQLAAENGTRFRWRLRTQVAGTTSSLVQVADGRFLWTDQILPTGQTVTRVDLRRLGRERLPGDLRRIGSLPTSNGLHRPAESEVLRFGPILPSGGGMPRLLKTLAGEYDFEPPRQAVFLGVSVYVVEGNRVGHPSRETDEREPAAYREPGRVRILLGRDDLFPYRLEYFGSELSASKTSARSSIEPTLRVEWHDVQLDGPIEPRSFDYDPPAETNWRDVTDELLRAENRSP